MSSKNQSHSPDSAVRENGDAGKSFMNSETDGATSRVSREFQSFIADIEELIRAKSSLSGDDLDRVKLKLGDRIESAKKTLEDMGGALSDQARSSVKATDTYVHEHPWRTLGTAGAVSLLVGVLFHRRQ